MEKLIINVPEEKSALIKELLKELGVTIEQEKMDMEVYRKKILQVGVWSDEDLKPIEEAREAFNSLKPMQW